MGTNRLKISEHETGSQRKRENYSTRGCYTIKEKCKHCKHPKKIEGCGRKKCAKCKKN